ncbi:hypothetical protein [Olleya namhaensis]|uniref:hypothetical protein n=1 Tax=Olleya namhaensis TaxID=1144750 RepID=UPI002492AC28|nr:hypothetical protein [Olleya namhaensis]
MTFDKEKYTDKKHLLIVGKSENERKKYVDNIISTSDKVIYRFKRNLKDFDEYIEEVRNIFPFIPYSWDEQNPKKWTLNQIWDFHLDWTDNTFNILIVLEEFDEIEDNWKTEIIRDYFTTSYDQEKENKSNLNFQLILTLEKENELIKNVISEFGLNENEKRTEEQIINGKLKIINLEWE